MQTIKTFSDKLEAAMAKDFLAAQNIMSEIDGARDYTSHVIGGLSGTFKLKVNSEDSTKAIQLLNELECPLLIKQKYLKRRFLLPLKLLLKILI